MNILHGYPVYRADAGAVSPDPSHPEIRWRRSRNINLGKFGLIAPTHFKLPTTSFFRKVASRPIDQPKSRCDVANFANAPWQTRTPSVLALQTAAVREA